MKKLEFDKSLVEHPELKQKEPECVKQLENINQFKDKLQYYNENIRSLSLYGKDGRITFYNDAGQQEYLYCGCSKCRKSERFNPEHEQIYFQLREKEIQRLVSDISNITTYKGKLEYFHKIKGIDLDTLKVFSSLHTDNEERYSEEDLESSIIDLTPKTSYEIIIHNEHLQEFYFKKVKDNNGFTSAYKGFNSKSEKEELNGLLLKAIDPIILIKNYIQQIEDYFNYPHTTNKDVSKTDSLFFYDVTDLYIRGKYIFRQLAFGKEIDINVQQISKFEFIQLTHIKELFDFYKYLRVLQNCLNDFQSVEKAILKVNSMQNIKLIHCESLEWENLTPEQKKQVEKEIFGAFQTPDEEKQEVERNKLVGEETYAKAFEVINNRETLLIDLKRKKYTIRELISIYEQRPIKEYKSLPELNTQVDEWKREMVFKLKNLLERVKAKIKFRELNQEQTYLPATPYLQTLPSLSIDDRIFTFEDWLQDKFVYEKDALGNPVCNDSEKYFYLVLSERMHIDTLDKIQEEQNAVYHYIINNTLIYKEKVLSKQIKESLDFKELINISIKKLEEFFKENERVYFEVLRPTTCRGIKFGAKFITSNQYLYYKENKPIDAFIPVFSNYEILLDGQLSSFPTNDQMSYLIMEFNILWQKRLKTIQENLLNNRPITTPAESGEEIPTETPELGSKPIFKPEAVPIIFNLLKDFFSSEHQIHFEQLLKNGSYASQPLLFLSTGNRLADAFKQLIETDFITGCQKKELESWISNRFIYRFRDKVKGYTPRYLNDIISTNKDKCRNPILDVTKNNATGQYLIRKA